MVQFFYIFSYKKKKNPIDEDKMRLCISRKIDNTKKKKKKKKEVKNSEKIKTVPLLWLSSLIQRYGSDKSQ